VLLNEENIDKLKYTQLILFQIHFVNNLYDSDLLLSVNSNHNDIVI
jgi:hypothetical protein